VLLGDLACDTMIKNSSIMKAACLSTALCFTQTVSAWPTSSVCSGQNDCSTISCLYEDAATRNESKSLTIKPSLMYRCLQSVPVAMEKDLAFTEWLSTYIQVQSTITILPNPPEGHLYPGVDIIGGLMQISTNLRQDVYKSQYDFILDIHRVINVKPRDGHLRYILPLLQLAQFESPVQYISVSDNNLNLPNVYLLCMSENHIRP
jgi:hypothetical protein